MHIIITRLGQPDKADVMAKEDVCAPAVRPCHHWLCLLKVHNPRVHLRHTSLFSQVIRRAGRPFSKVRVARSLHPLDDCCHRNGPGEWGSARLLAEMASQIRLHSVWTQRPLQTRWPQADLG